MVTSHVSVLGASTSTTYVKKVINNTKRGMYQELVHSRYQEFTKKSFIKTLEEKSELSVKVSVKLMCK